ncbi:MAG: peptidoglycan DD-metalloendopeptidase family protein, partial [Flavobacteriales bacterium]|nr:peptidoglycan DD-metalloendopeptidase family protein [Flavobacteriales bacterium]
QFNVVEGEVGKNQVLSQILSPFNVSALQIDQLVKAAEGVFDVRKIRPGKSWFILQNTMNGQTNAEYFIYQSNLVDYYVFQLQEPKCWKGSNPTETELRFSEGVIDGSLYLTLEKNGAPASLTMSMASLYAWSIDFYRIQKGDAYQVLYEIETIEGEPVSEPKILACDFFHKDRNFEAYQFDGTGRLDYYNERGGSLRKAFLKAPVKYSRISSKFQKKRFHPVLKRYKSHLGTDYAAPHGTPIVATADGTVIKSSYTKGNGKYVKIRHNGTYETQYLHMSKRAVKNGDYVKQGDVIGYVGSTGLATGPHVCYRFWKNGQQVDPFKQDLPDSESLPDSLMPSFEVAKLKLQHLTDSLRNEVVF